MGLTFRASSSNGTPPEVEAGITLARFDGVEEKVLEKSQYDPECFEWSFTLFEGPGAPLFGEDDEPVTVTALTSRSTNTKSKTTPRAVRYLKAIMTPAEFAAFEAEQGVDAEALMGRMVQLILSIKDTGWPKVEDVIPAPKQGKKAA